MKKRKMFAPLKILVIFSLLAGLTGSFGLEATGRSASQVAYIEPGLESVSGEMLSVVVSAQDSVAAAGAVHSIGGRVTSDLWLIDAVGALIPADSLDELAETQGVLSIVHNKQVAAAGGFAPPTPNSSPLDSSDSTTSDSDGWVTDYRFPVPWDGTDDVIATTSWGQYNLVYPTAIDAGTDQDYSVMGYGVTVAVVDSGIYFDEQVKSEMGQAVKKQYHGQADFVDAQCGQAVLKNRTIATGEQFSDHCFTDFNFSQDPYGHGTHVAGIIWNNLSEAEIGIFLGIAPGANILGVRVLGVDGSGSYERVIQGIQYVVANKDQFDIRVLNLSLSALQTTPYFVDPLNRAVEEAWAAGIVVLAAAGNEGPGAETITVPGNDPYVITVGAVDGRRTPGYWTDDIVPEWSSSGPTLDGFVKPDVLAPGAQIVSFMYNDHDNIANSATLVQLHPDHSESSSLFRMNGTSMATAVASGVAARMVQADPNLTPDEVKYRLMYTARQMMAGDGQLGMNLLQQGAGRIWAVDAVSAEIPAGQANLGMDLAADLAHGWGYLDENDNPVLDWDELAYHYLGPVRKTVSDDGSVNLYYIENADCNRVALGLSRALDNLWLLPEDMDEGITWSVGNLVWSGGANLVWSGGNLVWSGAGALFDASGNLVWSGGNLVWSGSELLDTSGNLVWSGGDLFDASGNLVWSGGNLVWSGGNLVWSGGNLVWSGGNLVWSGMSELFDASGNLVWSGGNLVWSGGQFFDASGNLVWSGGELFDGSGNLVWSGGNLVWSGGNLVWSGGNLVWSGGNLVWSGGNLVWSGAGELFDDSGNLVWSGGNLVWSGEALLDSSGNLVWSGGDLFDASGNLVWSGGNLVWSGGNLVWSGGNLVWSGSGALFDASGNLVWSGGNLVWSGSALFDASGNLVWAGTHLFDASGNLVWSGGELIWSGSATMFGVEGELVWSGRNLTASGGASFDPSFYQLWTASPALAWSGGNLVWSGGNLVWSGGNLVWSGGNLVWSGGNLVWSGGHLVWSGSLGWTSPVDSQSANLSSTSWVNWK